MPNSTEAIVINTTPIIVLTAATENLDVLRFLYKRIIVPHEVAEEIRSGGKDDLGEAAVIQTALQERVNLVCIDEVVGRRIARLSGLNLTGSIGILLKAKSLGYPIVISEALDGMRVRGIWLSQNVIRFALAYSQP